MDNQPCDRPLRGLLAYERKRLGITDEEVAEAKRRKKEDKDG